MRPRRWSLCILIPLVLLALIIGSCVVQDTLIGKPERYVDEVNHFKYGSIGSDNLHRGIPYRIFAVLPDLFADLFDSLVPANGKTGYQRVGLIVEDQQPAPDGFVIPQGPRPIGFSKRRIWGLDVVGMNCALCHTSTLRTTPETKTPEVILRMPANGFYAEAFFRFLVRAGQDPRFTRDNVLAEMKKRWDMPWYEKLLYHQLLIPISRLGLRNLGRNLSFLEDEDRTRFGPGRVETWAIYKILALQHSLALLDLVPELWSYGPDLDPRPGMGFADFPALWETKPHGPYHWDGNNPDLSERNTIAGIGAGITPPSRDGEALGRVGHWMEKAKAPSWNGYAPDAYKVREQGPTWTQGEKLYAKHCAQCHEPQRDSFDMGITPIGKIGTDRARLDSYTRELNAKLNTVGRGYEWHLSQFVKTEGYANMMLTGIWLRAPYLHNGSVPTLRDLLDEDTARPRKFWRGDDAYDWQKVGFRAPTEPQPGTERLFEYDTAQAGNENRGHSGVAYGTALSDAEKSALLEYLKTK